jgi:UDP-glucose 4-epimerase
VSLQNGRKVIQVSISETVLVTGAAGFIGSHTCVALSNAGYRVYGVDNFSNSNPINVDILKRLCGTMFAFDVCDVRDGGQLRSMIRRARPDSAIHFAALKSVPESVRDPLRYYDNNVGGSVELLESMRLEGVRKIVFSSSAMVYGSGTPPFSEDSPVAPANPYGATKLVVERIIEDVARSEPGWLATILRYFNPVGAHSGGTLGEDLETASGNLMPAVLRVATGRAPELLVFGSDYSTPDGTALRDYIHVMDLAEAHVLALRRADDMPVCTINLGTGRPVSVRELLAAFQSVTGRSIPSRIAARREGDVPSLFAQVDRSWEVLGWKARRSLEDMCRDAWRFAQRRYLSRS